MTYFLEIENYDTYSNDEACFRFNYNRNGGGGQSFLQGKYQDSSGKLNSPFNLNGLIATFKFYFRNKNGNLISVLLDDESTQYEIKPRASGEKCMKFAVGNNETPSKAIAAFLMLPETCSVESPSIEPTPYDSITTVLSLKNYWLKSTWLDVELCNDKTIYVVPKDCIFSGGLKTECKDNKVVKTIGTARYFKIDFQKRINDILSLSENEMLDSEVAVCIKHFADIYSGTKHFHYKESADMISHVMRYLSSKYPFTYSGVTDPLPMIKYLIKSQESLSNLLNEMSDENKQILAAIRAKPFILLAGMSGTGKTRIVRQLARGFCPQIGELASNPMCPGNYECIPVRPNWHDSTGLMGYITRITEHGKPMYVATEFVRFLAKAWLYEKKGIPFFLCLDEMNLAPVEQYFAEYLSVIESRQLSEEYKIVTDTLIKIPDKEILNSLINELYPDQAGTASEIISIFKKMGGIPIPSNLVVMGTVNMDETTCSFPRKVLDRAMTFELNEFNIDSGLESNPDIPLGAFPAESATCCFTHGWQVYQIGKDKCDMVKPYLIALDNALQGKPFRFAYRTRDEFMIYCFERMRDGTSLAKAADEATNMKILSRIEGDEQTVQLRWLKNLREVVSNELNNLMETGEEAPKVATQKLDEMISRLDSGFTSFWL